MTSRVAGARACFFSLLALLCLPLTAWAGAPHLANGFTAIDDRARILVMPPDVELFELSGGGVLEPKADWTETATRNIHGALDHKRDHLGVNGNDLSEDDADAFGEISSLHAAVARSIALHHIMGGRMALPTKEGRLDWSLGDAVLPIQQKTGADYALFVWMRDSYSSAGRKAMMFAMALIGVGIGGGMQQCYASLVDLHTGQVVWFNALVRGTGDVREAKAAEDSIEALLAGFPTVR